MATRNPICSLSLAYRYYYYPQYHWARAIARDIVELNLPSQCTLYDAPCGDGVISYWLRQNRSLCHLKFELSDISEHSIANARRWAYRYSNVSVIKQDLNQLPPTSRSDDVWLLINSLFLFKDTAALVAKLRPRFQYIIGVFPHIARENYQLFLQRPNSSENPSAMDQRETISFFERQGYHLNKLSNHTFFSIYRYRIRSVRRIAHCLFNLLDPLFTGNHGYYWMGVFYRT
jgi:hypothetical protein